MALINIEDDFDSWLSDFDSLERLAQQISAQITERDSQNTATEYNKISTRLKIQMRQFENEYKQLERKLKEKRSKITSDETERRYRNLEKLASKKVQLDSRFRGNSASSSRNQLFQTAERNAIEDDPILDTNTSIETFRSEQQQIMLQQDNSLDSLSKVIARQKNIAIRIGNEVDTQNEILDNLADQMDNVGSRVNSTTQNVSHVANKDSTMGYWMVILLLFIAIIVVGIL